MCICIYTNIHLGFIPRACFYSYMYIDRTCIGITWVEGLGFIGFVGRIGFTQFILIGFGVWSSRFRVYRVWIP